MGQNTREISHRIFSLNILHAHSNSRSFIADEERRPFMSYSDMASTSSSFASSSSPSSTDPPSDSPFCATVKQ